MSPRRRRTVDAFFIALTFGFVLGGVATVEAGPILYPCWFKFCFAGGKPTGKACLQCPKSPDCCNKKKPPNPPTSRTAP